LADGKRLWRVVDNLMNNITKYALSGTRVYLTARESGDRCELLFRNISAARPQRSGEELTERFVQGDLSRKSEGSGLGLAIAKSFTELQNGAFDVVVDGDLFKVILSFERI
jgi:signal transduction histidine kinase